MTAVTGVQLPDGRAVISSFALEPYGPGSLTSPPPRGGPLVPISGLGLDLTGSTVQTDLGANCGSVSPLDDALLVGVGTHATLRGVYFVDRTGAGTAIAFNYPGSGTGIAVAPDPVAYGTPSPGVAIHVWQTAPAPGGLPRVGNARFGVLVRATGGSPAGFILASSGPAQLPLLGLTALIDPSDLVPVAAIPVSELVAMPIPAGIPVGLRIYLQGFHPDPGIRYGVVASDGLRITFLP
ncbi:MAG: hypothetical protein IPM29_17875 [Planctomycetes bacterium]|nr:hypothetical protein [Planctomycetota bacterium]